MLDETLAALAATGATTIVAAMATDAWTAARGRIARLFGRRGRQSAIEPLLDDDAALVAAAGDAEQARQSLASAWQLRLERLLRDHPEAADELRDLIAETSAMEPGNQQHWRQSVIARENGTAFGAQGGDINVHYHVPAAGDGER